VQVLFFHCELRGFNAAAKFIKTPTAIWYSYPGLKWTAKQTPGGYTATPFLKGGFGGCCFFSLLFERRCPQGGGLFLLLL